MSTNTGRMDYNFSSGQIYIHDDVDLISSDRLILSGSSKIVIESPTNMQSEKQMLITSPIEITGIKDLFLQANGSIFIEQNITGKGKIDIGSNVDCIGVEGIEIFEGATIEAHTINIRGKEKKITIF